MTLIKEKYLPMKANSSFAIIVLHCMIVAEIIGLILGH